MAASTKNGLKELPPGVPPEQVPFPGGLVDEQKPPPKYGTGRPADPSGPVPRVIDPLERAPKKSGLSRFKIRCNNYHPQKTRYILAADAESAKACYLKANGLDKAVEKLKKAGGPVEEPDLVIVELED